MMPEHSTHAVELLPDRVIKRFRGRDRAGAEREWRALSLLAVHAPGLAACRQESGRHSRASGVPWWPRRVV